MNRSFAALLLLCACTVNAEIVVVVGSNSPVQSLERDEVADIFLAKTNRLSNGSHIKPIELADESFKADFYKAIAGKTLPQINSYWTTLIFTGKGRPPKSINKTHLLINSLNNDPKAISYLPREHVDTSLKVIYTFP